MWSKLSLFNAFSKTSKVFDRITVPIDRIIVFDPAPTPAVLFTLTHHQTLPMAVFEDLQDNLPGVEQPAPQNRFPMQEHDLEPEHLSNRATSPISVDVVQRALQHRMRYRAAPLIASCDSFDFYDAKPNSPVNQMRA